MGNGLWTVICQGPRRPFKSGRAKTSGQDKQFLTIFDQDKQALGATVPPFIIRLYAIMYTSPIYIT